ncbi:helix-turn-helix domain-containing protein [Kitasatospora sp. NPDC056181]|uniref:helix-turn-helix domain-containing protein n=1 Tax=Kitasatospora sp. NPDC056181 TaxID=3345737 RepID=UPI0035E121F0
MPPAKRKPSPVTDAERAEILRLHSEGVSRNEIMRRTGRSARIVTGTVQAAGGSFARAAEVVAATEARLIDLEERRTTLAHDLHQDAERLRAQLWQPHLYFDWGGKDHEYDERLQPEPTPADKRSLLGAAGLAIDRSLKLVPPKPTAGADDALSMLGALAAGIARINEAEEEPGEG